MAKVIFYISLPVVLLAAMFLGMLLMAKSDVRGAGLDLNSIVSLEGMKPSLSCGFYFTFEISGDANVSRAYWRLFPFRKVDIEK